MHPLWFYKHQHDNRVRSKLFVACQRWWFQWRFWFVPSVPGYKGCTYRAPVRYVTKTWSFVLLNKKIHVPLSQVYYVWQVVKTSTIISNNPVYTCTLDLKLRKKLVECYIWNTAVYGAETWTLRAVDQKHLESFEMWYWRRMEKIIWTDHVRNEEELLGVKEQKNILHEISKRKANWIGHILRWNCLLQQVIEGKIKGR